MPQLTGSDLTFGTVSLALIVFLAKEIYTFVKKESTDLQKADSQHVKAIQENTNAIMMLAGKVEYLMEQMDEVRHLKQEVSTLMTKYRN